VNQQTLKQIVEELGETITNCVFGKIFQLSTNSFAIDFRGRDGGYLLVSAEPSLPRLHLIARPLRELEKRSKTLDEFGQALRVNLSGAKLIQVSQDDSDRVVRFIFTRQEETGEIKNRVWVAQLTGRSANHFLLDEQGIITHSQRSLAGPGQGVGEHYAPPVVHREDAAGEPVLARGEFPSLSAAAENYYLGLEAARRFTARAASARARLRQETLRLQKLKTHLANDLKHHGDPEQHKRIGGLLLANISSAERTGNSVELQDYYTEGGPPMRIEVDEATTLQAAAADYFARYTKAKRAAEQIGRRLEEIEAQFAMLEHQRAALENIIGNCDEAALTEFSDSLAPGKTSRAKRQSGREPARIPGVRRYLSSDKYEVLVGRAAADNDRLTFRLARPQDLWLHAADYPGSHVVVRNPTRKDLPQRTIIEAAQLAARFSQANNATKVDVNYTQQKFVSRIKGAAPGLVRLSSFRTITVEPKEGIERI